MTVFTWGVILFLIAVNALYVAAEFAAVRVSRARVQQYADDGNTSAKRLLPVIRSVANLDRYIAACQIGITFSSLVLGAFGQVALSGALGPLLAEFGIVEAEASHALAAVIVLVGLTTFQMVLAELVPKSLALRFPTRIALGTVTAMRLSLKVFSPFIALLNGSGTLFLKLLRLPPGAHRHIHSADEVGLLFSESREGGLIDEEEHRRLKEALHLEHRKVAEIMVPRGEMHVLNIDATYDEVIREFETQPFTRWPVYEENPDNIIGMIHSRDLATLVLDSPEKFSLKRILRPPFVVPESMSAEDLLTRMREEHKQLAIVVDEFGTTIGLVGISDVLDELMGDIHEGELTDGESAQALPNGKVRVPAAMRLDEAAEWIGKEWEAEESFTVAGKILEQVGRIPRPGEVFDIDGVRVEISQANLRAIQSVLVTPVKREEEEAGEEEHEERD